MLMDRLPKVAFLWLGATVLGLSQKLLRELQFGMLPVDLHSASWSGVIQSFMQLPISDNLLTNGHVSRADECRLLFLCQSVTHQRFPICQWTPFGTTPLRDTDIETRMHADCRGHRLQYQKLSWDYINGKVENHGNDKVELHAPYTTLCSPKSSKLHVQYEGMDRDYESISENATRSIMG